MNNESSVNKIKRLYQFGQSPWYDNIDRRIIDNGELKGLLDMGVMGVTSNPTIFEKAINGSSVYDEKIATLHQQGAKTDVIYDELTADDVRDAADLFLGVYERTKGLDGYVSIEVLPLYANDANKTVEYARYILRKINRKNIMIKVPATPESRRAIRMLTREGINVNATLIFSVPQYEHVAAAYLEGLWDRLQDGKEINNIFSVASVFVSRIDTKTDQIIDALCRRIDDYGKREQLHGLKGTIAVSNCKMIYQNFKEIFSERSFGALKAKGANMQRPLWASTSTKNLAYSDLLYVDNLIGPFTVNTMPHQTLMAFADHGRSFLTLESKLERARGNLVLFKELGVNLESICDEALASGVEAFKCSFEAIIESLKKKAA
ncbi:MAG: transaldolase [Candidatus Omnitrophota bacterium]